MKNDSSTMSTGPFQCRQGGRYFLFVLHGSIWMANSSQRPPMGIIKFCVKHVRDKSGRPRSLTPKTGRGVFSLLLQVLESMKIPQFSAILGGTNWRFFLKVNVMIKSFKKLAVF
jgi:hypothetical protein